MAFLAQLNPLCVTFSANELLVVVFKIVDLGLGPSIARSQLQCVQRYAAGILTFIIQNITRPKQTYSTHDQITRKPVKYYARLFD
jgi:hypothetical protein